MLLFGTSSTEKQLGELILGLIAVFNCLRYGIGHGSVVPLQSLYSNENRYMP